MTFENNSVKRGKQIATEREREKERGELGGKGRLGAGGIKLNVF